MSPLDRPSVPSRASRALATQLPNVPSLTPRSRATWAIGLFVSSTIRTAPSRNSRSYFFRISDIATPYSRCPHDLGGTSVRYGSTHCFQVLDGDQVVVAGHDECRRLDEGQVRQGLWGVDDGAGQFGEHDREVAAAVG